MGNILVFNFRSYNDTFRRTQLKIVYFISYETLKTKIINHFLIMNYPDDEDSTLYIVAGPATRKVHNTQAKLN